MVAASLQVRDEIEQRKRELSLQGSADSQRRSDAGRIRDAAIFAFKTRTQRVIDNYFQALDDCGIAIDAGRRSAKCSR